MQRLCSETKPRKELNITRENKDIWWKTRKKTHRQGTHEKQRTGGFCLHNSSKNRNENPYTLGESLPHFQHVVNSLVCFSWHPEHVQGKSLDDEDSSHCLRISCALAKSRSLMIQSSGKTSAKGTSPAKDDPC